MSIEVQTLKDHIVSQQHRVWACEDLVKELEARLSHEGARMKQNFHASGICDCCDGPPEDEPAMSAAEERVWAALREWGESEQGFTRWPGIVADFALLGAVVEAAREVDASNGDDGLRWLSDALRDLDEEQA